MNTNYEVKDNGVEVWIEKGNAVSLVEGKASALEILYARKKKIEESISHIKHLTGHEI